MSKTFRRAAMSSICMLIVAVMSLTGATYAWFSSADQAVVGTLNVSVIDAAGGVEISTDMENWTSNLTTGLPNLANCKFKPISTVETLTNGAFAFYGATLGTDKNTITTKTAADSELVANTSGWVEFTLYFRNTSATQPVNIDLWGTTISALEVTGDNAEVQNKANTDVLKAVRLGMADWGDITIAEGVTTTSFASAPTTGLIYEPNATVHTTNGVLDGAVEGQAHTYYGVSGVTDTAINRKAATAGVLTQVNTKKELTDMTITVDANSYAKVTFYLWIEGQDADCQNDVANTSFKLDLKLTSLASELRNTQQPEGN